MKRLLVVFYIFGVATATYSLWSLFGVWIFVLIAGLLVAQEAKRHLLALRLAEKAVAMKSTEKATEESTEKNRNGGLRVAQHENWRLN